MNVVSYGDLFNNFRFDDNSIISGKLNLANSLAFDSLVPDEMTIEVVSKDTGKSKVMVQPRPEDAEQVLNWYTTSIESGSRGYVVWAKDIRRYVYGDPVRYTYDGNLIGKFYLKNVVRLSPTTWRINMISAVGLWVNMVHLGGVYTGQTAGELIADILNGVTYTIDDDVAAVQMFGWLPVASARDNLQQVLFAIGASITKTSSGNPRIQFLKNLPTVPLPDERVFLGSSIDYRTPATQIDVTEHTYYKSNYGETISLYDNADGTVVADNLLVTFSEPCYDLIWLDGNTQVQTAVSDLGWTYGDNYCYVTGTGVLSGTKYSHSARIFSVNTGADGETNIKRIEDATLVSPVNSPNVAARVSEYYGKTDATSCGITLIDDSIKTGTKVSFTDPYDGTTETGVVETMDVTLSGNLKADATILKGYTPSHFGNTYKNCVNVQRSFQLPVGVERIKIIVGGGGEGGQGGFNGTAGSSGKDFDDNPYCYGGTGGAGGVGGKAGKVYEVEVDLSADPTATWDIFVYPSFGNGGAANGGAGQPAADTLVDLRRNNVFYARYSSADGEHRNGGYYEVFSGGAFSLDGADGVTGGNGGDYDNRSGQNVSYYDIYGRLAVKQGGAPGTDWEGSTTRYTRYAKGGSGGGAAFGAGGQDGKPGDEYHLDSGVRYGSGGKGADGQLPYPAKYGCGGNGGHGGGGGGTGGWYVYQSSDRNRDGFGPDGDGGVGSAGGSGGIGYALVYY